MSHGIKRLHDDDDPTVKAFQEADEEADRTCRKEFATREVDETVTDVRTAIRHLPKRYFKNAVTNTGICLENTQSGIRTIVGRIKRVRRKRVEEAKKSDKLKMAVGAISIILILSLAVWLAYFFVNSLLDCYNPAAPQQTASANP